MNLLRNQIRKEIRQHGLLLGGFAAMLVLELIRNLGTTATIFQNDGTFIARTDAWFLIYFLGLALACLAAVGMGMSDSPSNPEGLIQTRPVPRATIWGAKALVLAVFVLLPAAAVPLILNLVHGAGIANAVHAAGERLAFGIPLAGFFLCWGGLCSSPGHLGRMTMVAAGVFMGVVLLTMTVWNVIDSSVMRLILAEPGSLPLRILFCALLAALVAGFALLRQIRGPRHRRRPLHVVTIVALGIGVIFSIPGLNLLKPIPNLPDGLAAALTKTEVYPDIYSVSTSVHHGVSPGEKEIYVQTKIEVDNLPASVVLEPTSIHAATLKGPGGFAAQYQEPADSALRHWDFRPSESVLQSLAERYEREIVIYTAGNSPEFRQNSSIHSTWDANLLGGHLEDPLDLELVLHSDCISLEPIVQVPLRAGASQAFHGMRFTVIRPQDQDSFQRYYALRARLPRHLLTRDQNNRLVSGWQSRHRFLCLLIHPRRPEALVPEPFWIQTKRGSLSGMPELFFVYNYGTRSEYQAIFDEAFFDEAEIHLFRLDWQGVHVTKTELTNLNLSERMTPTWSSVGNRELGRAAYLRALDQLGEVPPKVDEVYLRTLLRIIDGSEHWQVDLGDPAYRRLLEIGRRDLQSLIDAFDMGMYRSHHALRDAIDRIATPASKERILSSLVRQPSLATVVVNHGWTKDARNEILALLHSRRSLPFDALRAAVLLDDPETYPYLLEHFDHFARAPLYELLWQTPALRGELDKIVRAKWEASKQVIVDRDAVMRDEVALALRVGSPRALDLALETLQSEPDYQLVEMLRPVLLLDRNYQKAQESLVGMTAEDFVFDPERRVFLSQPENP